MDSKVKDLDLDLRGEDLDLDSDCEDLTTSLEDTHTHTHARTHAHALRFNGHFPGEPGLAETAEDTKVKKHKVKAVLHSKHPTLVSILGKGDRYPKSGVHVGYKYRRLPNCLFVCLGFNGTFSTNRLYRAITVGKYVT